MKFGFESRLIVGFLLGVCCVINVNADVVLDGSLGVKGEITAIDGKYAISDANGQISGSNLFHSFETINLADNEVATFSGPGFVQNVIARITGGKSTINGTIASDIPGANLWLLNPEGILFGENAALDIQGSFHATTADYIRLRNGNKFYGSLGFSDVLADSSPQSFGFIDPEMSSATIQVANAELEVNENQSITLLGNSVSLRSSLISAPGGNITVVSINESGEVIYSDQGLDTSTIENFGSVSIDSTAFILNGEQQGKIQIKGGELEINSKNTDFVNSVTSLKTSFFEDQDLLEKPCELADFYNQGKMNFTINLDEDETEYGVKSKKTQRGPIGFEVDECL